MLAKSYVLLISGFKLTQTMSWQNDVSFEDDTTVFISNFFKHFKDQPNVEVHNTLLPITAFHY